MNKKKYVLTITLTLLFTMVFITATNAADPIRNKTNIKADGGSSVSQGSYTRGESIAIAPIGPAPAADTRSQGASIGMDLPVKSLPIETISEKDVKIKKDQAIEIAKTLLDDPSLYTAGNIYLNPMYGIYGVSGANWTIDFTGKNASSNVNVTIDANTGKVIGFNNWNNDETQQNTQEFMTREQALVIAEKMLREKFGIDLGKFEIQKEDMSIYDLKMPVGGTRVYYFNYTRLVNGVLFPFETINVSIDGVSGQLRNYYHNESQFDFNKLPSKDNAISAQKALEQYRNAVGMSLQYITVYQDKPKAVLVYAPTNYLYMLDAVSGKPLNYDGQLYNLPSAGGVQLIPMDPDATIGAKQITEKEAAALAEKYKEMAENLYGIKFDDANKYTDRYQQNSEDIWNGSWYRNDKNDNFSFYISINLNTGHIVNLSLSKYDNGGIMPMEIEKGAAASSIVNPAVPDAAIAVEGSQGQTQAQPPVAAQEPAIMPAPDYVQKPVEINEKFDRAAGREKALDFIKAMLPETYGFFAESDEQPVMTDEAMKYTREHTYTFVRIVNGIAYRENSISVSVDRETGEIRNMYYGWSDLDFQKPDGIISSEKAENKYFGDMEAKLSYYLITSYDYNTGTVADVKPVLVYNFTMKSSPYAPYQYVDAFTGEFVNNGYMMRDAVSSTYAK